MLFQLGEYKFEGLKLPLSWGINFATNYAQIPIIDGKPVVQRLNEKLVEQELTVLFSDEFCNPKTELNALQLYRRNGNVLPLTGGDGTNYGKYVITEISVINERADHTGYISAISASIKLLEYNASATEIQSGDALTSSKPTPMAPKEPTVSGPMSISKDISAGQLKASSLKAHSSALAVNYRKIMSICDDANARFDSANAKIIDAEKIYTRATQLITSIENTKEAITRVKNAADIQNLSDLLNANDDLEAAIYQLNGANAPLAAFIASREAGI